MKNYFIAILALVLPSLLFCQEDYTITINGKKMDVALDKEFTATINGKSTILKVNIKDTLSYNDAFFNFKYPSDFKISKIQVEQGVEQLTIMSAEGSGIIIQRYSTINPKFLNEMMMNEVTKESVNYGYDLVRKDYNRKLKNGVSLQVAKAVLTYEDDVNTYEIASHGLKDSGVLIMTMTMNEENKEQGEKIIKMLWDTLEIKI